MHPLRALSLMAVFAAAASCGAAREAIVTEPPAVAEAPAPAPSNPLLQTWDTPFGLPPFDRVREDHYLPALKEGIARARQEVRAIAARAEPATFANTIEALDRSGELLDRVRPVFFNLLSADATPGLQAIAQEAAPLLAALEDDTLLDPALFARVQAVYAARDALDLDPEQRRLVEETSKRFVRGGAALPPEGKERLRAMHQELSVLGLQFGDNLLAETNGFQLFLESRDDLKGLSEGTIAAAADAAAKAGQPGRWLFTLQAPSLWPFLQQSERRDLRRKMLDAYAQRGDRGNDRDNRAGLVRQAALRAEKARLLGYASWAHYVLEDRMAATPARVRELLDRVWKPARKAVQREARDLQQAIRKDGQAFKLAPHDWAFYTERIRKQRYGLDDGALRPYFALENVLQGAFTVANRLYGITFVERKGLPVYHPEVRAFEVLDADGSHLGIFLADYHPRPGKRGGAWATRYRGQWIQDGRDVRPLVVNVGNFTRPSGDTPALLSLEEVETLFHELGHGLHALLSRIRYRSLAGVPRDFVELPSQVMENWVLEPEVLKLYARHWKTDEVIPAALVTKIQKARRFNQGFATTEYLAASYLDLAWHDRGLAAIDDPRAFEADVLSRLGLVPEVLPRYRSTYFQHIFGPGGGYSAGYYSYMWSEVLDADAFAAFQEKGLFDPATARAFRTEILERGNTADAMELYKRFRGREPEVRPLLVRRGLL